MKYNVIQDEDFTNYKKCSLFIGLPFCDFKCERELGLEGLCQNSPLAKAKIKESSNEVLLKRFLDNPLTEAIVFGGLEPILSFDELISFISLLRTVSDADCIIYTGYYKNEIEAEIEVLKQYNNIIVKYGRFIPNAKSRYDDVLGITLVSDNQYAEKIS